MTYSLHVIKKNIPNAHNIGIYAVPIVIADCLYDAEIYKI